MTRYLLLSVRFLDSRYHGQTAHGDSPEWPPSPFRVFQALIAGNAHAESIEQPLASALQWLESLSAPDIIAPQSKAGHMQLVYVLNNRVDRSRTPKAIRPTLLKNGDALLQYAWAFDSEQAGASDHADAVIDAARRLRALGWGIDLAIGHGEVVDRLHPTTPRRVHYRPNSGTGVREVDLRTPHAGSLKSLQGNYAAALRRYAEPGITYLESADAIYETQSYDQTAARPTIFFQLQNEDGSVQRYPQSKLVHIAGMLRHLAIQTMKVSPPEGVSDDWVETYVAGHARGGAAEHRQFSYLPMPSIGHAHVDPAVRRVMIAAPLGDDRLLLHLARRLDGQQLETTPETKLDHSLALVRVRRDKVASCYTEPANTWASVTPVILPGHDDHKPDKTRKLIEKALAQSGIDQPCEFEWNALSYFPKSLSSHKYDRNKRPTGYIRPSHLLSQTAVHLRLRFFDDLEVPGPMAIGAGRHCGLGLMARIDAR